METEPKTRLKVTHIALDEYDDIFSDFDISPYPKRLLSYDFLKELHRRYAETKKGDFEITFTLPADKRSARIETVVRKRLKGHFRDRLEMIDRKVRDKRIKGAAKLLAGFAVSLILFSNPFQDGMPFVTMLSVLVWYFLWSGYTDIFESAGRAHGKKEFYSKLLNAKYEFLDEEKLLGSIREPAPPSPQKRKGSS